MKVAITDLQLKLLRENIETAARLNELLLSEHPPVIEGETYVLQEFREDCSDVLNRIGFDINYELNENGRALEDLVDKLFVP